MYHALLGNLSYLKWQVFVWKMACMACSTCSSILTLFVSCSLSEPIPWTQEGHDVSNLLTCIAYMSSSCLHCLLCLSISSAHHNTVCSHPIYMCCRYSGIAFMIAAIILCASQNIAMIVIGRVLQGIAVSNPHPIACLCIATPFE